MSDFNPTPDPTTAFLRTVRMAVVGAAAAWGGANAPLIGLDSASGAAATGAIAGAACGLFRQAFLNRVPDFVKGLFRV